MKSLKHSLILVLGAGVMSVALAGAPLIQWVPALLDQVMIYLYPKNQEKLYPDTLRMKRILASRHGFVCRTKILVTTPQTVAFYRGHNKVENYLGITQVGQWMDNQRMCLDGQRVSVVTWDKQGNAQRYLSKRAYANINQMLTLSYPRDFTAPSSQTRVACNVKVLNQSKRPLVLYAGKIAADTRVALLKPFASTTLVAPCFKQQQIIAVQISQSKQYLSVTYSITPNRYTDINQMPILEFPKQFSLTHHKSVTLNPDLMKLLLAAL